MNGQPTPVRLQDDVSGDLLRVRNSHGYGFHSRTIEECLKTEWRTTFGKPWGLAVAEYPVELYGKSTSIDFFLGSGTHSLVAECNGVKGWTWGFARGALRGKPPRSLEVQQ